MFKCFNVFVFLSNYCGSHFIGGWNKSIYCNWHRSYRSYLQTQWWDAPYG